MVIHSGFRGTHGQENVLPAQFPCDGDEPASGGEGPPTHPKDAREMVVGQRDGRIHARRGSADEPLYAATK